MNTRQHNNPFLAMLAAVDDLDPDNAGAAAAANNIHQQRFSNNLRLPEFWSAAPAIWFARAKLRFEVARVLS